MNNSTSTGETVVVQGQPTPGSKAATVDPDHRTIRVISVEVANARDWHIEAQRMSRPIVTFRPTQLVGSKAWRARQAAMTADLLGVPCGIITGVREEPL